MKTNYEIRCQDSSLSHLRVRLNGFFYLKYFFKKMFLRESLLNISLKNIISNFLILYMTFF